MREVLRQCRPSVEKNEAQRGRERERGMTVVCVYVRARAHAFARDYHFAPTVGRRDCSVSILSRLYNMKRRINATQT